MIRSTMLTSLALAALVATTALGGAAAGAAAAPAAATAGSASPPRPALSLPRPTGPYPVGVRTASISDPARIDHQTGRPRRLPVRVWYPAVQHGPGPPAPYVTPAVQADLEQGLGLPTGWLDVDTHAAPDAPGRHRLEGVLLVQHGAGTLAAFQTGQVIDLASRGYAVVTMEHPHESLLIAEPDGTLIPGDDPETRPVTERLQDAEVVLDQLPRLVPQATRRTPIGMFGHSRGGATAAEVMFHHPQVVAGVDLDGSPRGDVLAGGLDNPFGLMLSREYPRDDPQLVDFLSRLRGPHPVRQLDVLHYGYTDWVVFNPQATRADPVVGAHLEQLVGTGTVDNLRAGRAALTAQRQFLSRFMSRHLNKQVAQELGRGPH